MCIRELIKKNHGESKWEETLQKSSVPMKVLLPVQDVSDSDTMKIMKTASSVLRISMNQFIDAFGQHWSTLFAPKMYRLYFTSSKSSKEFLTKLDSIHVTMTQRMSGASPPRFTYDWQDDKTLIMSYSSKRGLVDLAIACIHGVGKYYNEKLIVTKLPGDKIKIVFP
ncbi:hypothetical protein FTV88_2732 [Heliorestis convoluta]|uniref:Heme NO-binding domain-containing protein n=2 Tax=Heliorestis convoluta TaxID=356322 RepID=A0A5Q2N3E1_9FIRM|nr:hypothetical protein FTV88_2732 [Heliorestis convoluta]